MPTHFNPDPTDTRYQDDIDKRCMWCGWPGTEHYNSECPKEAESDAIDWHNVNERLIRSGQ